MRAHSRTQASLHDFFLLRPEKSTNAWRWLRQSPWPAAITRTFVLEPFRHATFQIPDPDPQRGPGRGRNPLSYPDGARRLPAQGGGRRLLVPASRLAGHPEDIQNYPRGNESRGRARGLLARGYSGRAVAGIRPLGAGWRAAFALQGCQPRSRARA